MGAREDGVCGPVTVAYPFATWDEAILRANNVKFGLQAAILTMDLDATLQAPRRLECGGVMISDTTGYRIDAMPFGGVKGSGLAREGPRHA